MHREVTPALDTCEKVSAEEVLDRCGASFDLAYREFPISYFAAPTRLFVDKLVSLSLDEMAFASLLLYQ